MLMGLMDLMDLSLHIKMPSSSIHKLKDGREYLTLFLHVALFILFYLALHKNDGKV